MKYFVSASKESLFEEVVNPTSVATPTTDMLTIDLTQKRQVLDGFGASFTDSSAYLVDKVLSETDRETVMKGMFDVAEGIGLSVIRNPMGASDYSRSIYSYDDQPEGQTDEKLAHFTIEHDRESILPLTKWALALNPDLKFFASPWSPPGWMKDSRKMVTGKLLPEFYGAYANYFAKFIEAYEQEGLPVYAVTPQNEPLYIPPNYPGMDFPAEAELDFVKNHLRPLFTEKGLATKILGYDHNWDRVDYAFDLLDGGAEDFDGIAWHWYGGLPVNQSRVVTAFPNHEVHFTEGSGGEWIPEFEPAFSNLMRNGIDTMRHHSKSFILWNIALDERNGPTVPGFGNSTCRGLLKINQETQSFDWTIDYYGLAHFSKYTRAGATRIETEEVADLKNVVFENKDGSIVVVLFNDSISEKMIEIKGISAETIKVKLPAKSAGTVVL